MMSCRLNNRSVRQARIGLIAMLLLTFGPLIGQLTAPKMSSGIMMSEMPMSQMMSSMDHDHDHAKMNHAWFDQCGYCSLALNFPFLSSSIPDVIRETFQVTPALVEFVRSAFRANTLFLLALQRAPPNLHG